MEKHRIVDIEQIEFESESEENTLRPINFDNYIGQEHIKKILNVSIQASKKRADTLDHMLFFGPPGLGKTTIAHIIANDMGSDIKVITAPTLEKGGDLAAILTNLNKGDILFIDEIHRLSPAIEEILYPAMEDFRLDIIIGSGPAAQTIKVDIERFTLIGATTRAGMLSNALYDRFGHSFRMSFYNELELSYIIKNASEKLGTPCNQDSAMEISRRSRGTPRVALRLLKRVRDYADVSDEKVISVDRAKSSLDELGVNELGFDKLDLDYLNIVGNSKKPLGLNTIAAALSEDSMTIEDMIEPYLLANGYIEKTAKGRVATRKTYGIIKLENRHLL